MSQTVWFHLSQGKGGMDEYAWHKHIRPDRLGVKGPGIYVFDKKLPIIYVSFKEGPEIPIFWGAEMLSNTWFWYTQDMTLGRTKSAKAFNPRCPPTHQTLRAQLLHIAPGNVLGAVTWISQWDPCFQCLCHVPNPNESSSLLHFSDKLPTSESVFVCQLVLRSCLFLDERLNSCKPKLSVWLWMVWETLLTTNYQTMHSFQQHTHRTCMVM